MEKNADYQISMVVNNGIMEIVISGEIKENAIEKLQNEVIALAKSTNAAAAIVDVRAVKGRFGLAEAYFRVRNYPADTRQIVTAIVDTSENADFESFHELTAINAGIPYKWFTDIDAARIWLRNRDSEAQTTAHHNR